MDAHAGPALSPSPARPAQRTTRSSSLAASADAAAAAAAATAAAAGAAAAAAATAAPKTPASAALQTKLSSEGDAHANSGSLAAALATPAAAAARRSRSVRLAAAAATAAVSAQLAPALPPSSGLALRRRSTSAASAPAAAASAAAAAASALAADADAAAAASPATSRRLRTPARASRSTADTDLSSSADLAADAADDAASPASLADAAAVVRAGSRARDRNRKRSRSRRSAAIAVSESSDNESPPRRPSSSAAAASKLSTANGASRSTPKHPPQSDHASSASGDHSIPNEERPYHDFFPDLDIDQPLTMVKFDLAADVDAQQPLGGRPALVADASNVRRSALTVAPPPSLSLPPLSTEALKAVPAPSFKQLPAPRSSKTPQRLVAPLPPYARYIEPTEDELSKRVEYDIDDQGALLPMSLPLDARADARLADHAWLELFNSDRRRQSLRPCTYELFEAVIDVIEKEWFDLTKDLPKAGRDEAPYPEDITCAVCDDGEAENSNAIVFCDGCNLAVHQDCYGVPFIPEGQWLCRKCMLSPETPVSCIFCPVPGGAFKQTNTNRWAHLTCAIWIPECSISNTVYMEPIEGIESIPKGRWKLTCYICKKRYGAPIQCCNKSCFAPFHVSCGRKAKLYMRMRGVPGSSANYKLSGGSSVSWTNSKNAKGANSVEATGFRAYCDKHGPREYRESFDCEGAFHAAQEELLRLPMPHQHSKKGLHTPGFGGNGNSDDDQSVMSFSSSIPRKRRHVSDDSGDEMQDISGDTPASSALAQGAEPSSAARAGASSDAGGKAKGSSSKAAVAKTPRPQAAAQAARGAQSAAAALWQHSNGGSSPLPPAPRPSLSLTTPVVPYYILHQILEKTAEHLPKKKADMVVKIAKYWALKRESRRGAALLKRLHLEPWTASASASREDEENKLKRYEILGRLRRDLERVRMLIELVRKREKEKERICKLQMEYVSALVNPLRAHLRPVLEQLKNYDRNRIFAVPVPLDEVPDYLEFVKQPMDFQTMGERIEANQYVTVDDFESDIKLIVNNCLLYNRPDTVYAKAAQRLDKYAEPLIARLRERVAAAERERERCPPNLDPAMFEL